MHKWIFIALIFSYQAQAGIITCADTASVGAEAKLSLHTSAQERAQRAAEDLVEKKVVYPYVDMFGKKASNVRRQLG